MKGPSIPGIMCALSMDHLTSDDPGFTALPEQELIFPEYRFDIQVPINYLEK